MSHKAVKLELPEPMLSLAKAAGVEPKVILEGFMRDLLRLPRSHGSDERTLAGQYFLRMIGHYTSYEEWEKLEAILSTDRRG
jgi:hypothetical protein